MIATTRETITTSACLACNAEEMTILRAWMTRHVANVTTPHAEAIVPPVQPAAATARRTATNRGVAALTGEFIAPALKTTAATAYPTSRGGETIATADEGIAAREEMTASLAEMTCNADQAERH